MYKYKNVLYLINNYISLILIFLIRIYKLFSACFPPKCRFYPSCSTYMIQSIEKNGVIKGVCNGTIRICKCHPFNPGGYDPVK